MCKVSKILKQAQRFGKWACSNVEKKTMELFNLNINYSG